MEGSHIKTSKVGFDGRKSEIDVIIMKNGYNIWIMHMIAMKGVRAKRGKLTRGHSHIKFRRRTCFLDAYEIKS